jgi:hypothetical protein
MRLLSIEKAVDSILDMGQERWRSQSIMAVLIGSSGGENQQSIGCERVLGKFVAFGFEFGSI